MERLRRRTFVLGGLAVAVAARGGLLGLPVALDFWLAAGLLTLCGPAAGSHCW